MGSDVDVTLALSNLLAAGYGYDYVISTMDRIKAAALSQDDKMLQMPIITPISSETWAVKESMASEEDALGRIWMGKAGGSAW